MQRVTVIVPLKALAFAKGRMSSELDPAARRELATWMLERVLSACHACDLVERVVVIAGDADGAAEATRHGAQVLAQTGSGLPAALAQADAALQGCPATLVLAADLPLAEAADLELVIRAAPDEPAVVVVPTRDGGTGALLRRPGTVIGTAYGPDSAAAHLALAQAAGIPAVCLPVEHLSVDIDTPDQLAGLGPSWGGAFHIRAPGA